MKRVIALLILTNLFFATSTVFAQSAREATHIVRPGETLAVIASQYDVALNDLAAVNGIYNYHLIHSWQELAIPDESSAAIPPIAGGNIHVVSYGETLGAIAESYGLALYDLMTPQRALQSRHSSRSRLAAAVTVFRAVGSCHC